MPCSLSSWLLRLASPLPLLLLVSACEPSSDDGGSEESDGEALACEGADSPPPCVGLDAVGCLIEPVGDATCTNGEWTCSEPFTAPKLDPDAICATPPAGDCDTAPLSCSDQSLSGECSDAVISAPAFCVSGEWTCPPGYHDEGESSCEWGESEGGG